MHCCHNDCDPAAPASPAPARKPRRIVTLIQWALPITTLALIPKCPMCVAGYVLLFTGIGLSVPTAAAMRWTLIIVSVAAIAYLLFRAARRAVRGVP